MLPPLRKRLDDVGAMSHEMRQNAFDAWGEIPVTMPCFRIGEYVKILKVAERMEKAVAESLR